MNLPQSLVHRYREGRLVPFVGAGVSISVEWEAEGQIRRGMSWRELVNKAIEELGFEPALLRMRGTELQILEYFSRRMNRNQLVNWMVRYLDPPDAAINGSAIHAGLAQLSRCNLLYTTNFDDFIERAFRLHGVELKPVAEVHEIPPTGARELIKFHGDLTHPSELVLSESDYERRLRLATAMDHRLRSDLLNRAVLFIGYSFRDWNVAYLFRLLKEDFGGTLRDSSVGGAPRGYITVANPSDFEYTLFAARSIEVIPTRTGHETEDVAQILHQLRRADGQD